MTENKIVNGDNEWLKDLKYEFVAPNYSILANVFSFNLAKLLKPDIVNRAVLDQLDNNKCGMFSCQECYG